jgi:2-polyprenyl-3-methyl-5-hydroxy-6-metoxy-1,4-benzoquinol methylase
MSTLTEHRLRAAEASAGMSDEPIYAAFERILDRRGARGDLLDYGAGVGALAERLHSSGRFASVTGADLLPRPGDLDPAIAWLHGDLNQGLSCAAESFDTVVAAEVIEHLENPRAVAREWARILRPGGLLVVSTPNNESWRSLAALLVRGNFVAFGDTCYPAHITALVRKDLERILEEAGFSGFEVGFSDHGSLPGWPHRSWQGLSAGWLGGLRFSDNVLASAVRINPSPGER